ncbi:hypothetical protein [Candidatus Avelusimicrobium gallicola]|uniref:Lipoprotein n=1 Tax=Candidatus Avelusimicrobium gallicola TaxID=2562704 RepID=A0A1Y4DIS8_9BACT|nr:hypothetical protein [Elusimicrobium sp. An273]OUO56220.1 hypothetical protein B5F75_06270 [Elusimicrobium sp. An273]
MKKMLGLLFVSSFILLAGCQAQKEESPYNRTNPKQDYERLLRTHVFAACQNPGKPYALYSLATLNKRPSDNDPRYKVTFFNGPCEGQTVWTTDVLLKTAAVGAEPLPKGTVLLRNFWNPKDPYDTEKADRWHIGVVSSSQRLDKGIVDMEFPRDRNDFMPAREGVYLHNVRYITKPEVKDVRTFL